MKKILLVEDEAALQMTLGLALRKAGYDVVSAINGDDALRIAKSDRPDLILLDLILPKQSGFEVLESVKKDPETVKIPVIVLTNLEGMVDVDHALSLGATTYLVKANYAIEDILSKVQQSLGVSMHP